MDPNISESIKNSLTNVLRFCSPHAHTRDLVNALDHVLTDLKSIKSPAISCDDTLGKLLMFPVFQLLKRDSLPDEVTERVFQIMTFTLRYCWHSNLQTIMAKQLLDVMLYLIGGSPASPKQPSDYFLTEVSNDTKKHGCLALIALYRASIASGIVEQLADSPASASFNVTVLLNCIEHGTESLELQLAALDALKELCISVIGSGDKLSLMLPGIMSTVTKVLAGKFGRCHYKVKQSVYVLLGELLPVIFDGKDFGPDQLSKKRFRTESWLKATKEQIRQAFATLSASRKSNVRSEVYDSMVELYAAIISHCSTTLDNCIGICIDGLIFISSLSNTHQGSAEKSRRALEKMAMVPSVEKQIEVRMYSLIESIPRVFSKHEESEPLSVLNGLSTLISTMPSLDEIPLNNLIRLIGNSLGIKPVDSANGSLIIPQMSIDSTAHIASGLHMVRLQDFGFTTGLNDAVQNAASMLLSKIGGTAKLGPSVLGSLFNQISNSPSLSASVPEFWMLIGVLSGMVAQNNISSESEDMMQLLNTEAAPAGDDTNVDLVWDISTYSIDILSEAGNVQAYGTVMNSQQICLSLTALSLTAEYFGKEFRHSLVDALFPIVNMLGHTDRYVVNAAQRAIIAIADSCEYETVRHLLVDNVDYLIDGISIKFDTLDITPQTPKMLSSMVKLTGPSVIPYMDDLVASMFVILDNYHGYLKLCEGIFSVCGAFVEEVTKAYIVNKTIMNYPAVFEEDVKPLRSSTFVHITTVARLIELLNYNPQVEEDKLWRESNPSEQEQDSDDEGEDEAMNRYDRDFNPKDPEDDKEAEAQSNEGEQDEDKWPSVIPKPTFMIIKRILEYCMTFLTHESKILRFNLTLLITKCIPLIATNQEEYLPLVNQYWPLLIDTLGKDEVFITEATLQCIGITCRYAGDFMRSRVINLWESRRLRLFISSKPVDKLPQYSNESRLLHAVVRCITDVLLYTAVSPEVFDSIVREFKPHFVGFPELKASFVRVNADVVWLEEYYENQKLLTA